MDWLETLGVTPGKIFGWVFDSPLNLSLTAFLIVLLISLADDLLKPRISSLAPFVKSWITPIEKLTNIGVMNVTVLGTDAHSGNPNIGEIKPVTTQMITNDEYAYTLIPFVNKSRVDAIGIWAEIEFINSGRLRGRHITLWEDNPTPTENYKSYDLNKRAKLERIDIKADGKPTNLVIATKKSGTVGCYAYTYENFRKGLEDNEFLLGSGIIMAKVTLQGSNINPLKKTYQIISEKNKFEIMELK